MSEQVFERANQCHGLSLMAEVRAGSA